MRKNIFFRLLVISYWLWFSVFASSLYAQTLNSGLDKYRQGNLEEAITDFESVITKEDEKPKTKELAGQYFINCVIELTNRYNEKKDYQKALGYLEKGMKFFPDNSEIGQLYLDTQDKAANAPPAPVVPEQVPAKVTQPSAAPKQEPATTQPAPAKKETTVPKAVSQPASAPKPAPAAVPQPSAVSPQVPATASQPVPAKTKPAVPKVTKEANTTKPQLTVTEVPLSTARRSETKKPTAAVITEERLKLLEEKITVLAANYELERKELADKLAGREKTTKRIVFSALLAFLFLVFVFQRKLRNLIPGDIPRISAVGEERIILPNARDTEKIFSEWIGTLENKDIVQIITVLLNRPEENLRAKGFEILERIMKTKKFTPDEQWKIERTIRKIGLEEGWVGK